MVRIGRSGRGCDNEIRLVAGIKLQDLRALLKPAAGVPPLTAGGPEEPDGCV